MKRQPIKKTQMMVLALVLAVLLLGWGLLGATKSTVPAADYGQKLRAAEMTQACLEEIRQLKEERGVPISSVNDINDTGVVGQDYSFITTTLGNLEAKRTSTNPNMAAMVVDMFHELGLQPGDKVAVNCSGSFPALNIAVMCAVEVMELDPMLMTSFGSSTHGANDPELTYLDMEYDLLQKGLLKHKSDYFSIGGREDVGAEMPEAVVNEIVDRLTGYGYTFFYHDGLLDNIRERYEMYRAFGDVKCFINVGGNDVSFGNSKVIVYSDGGILSHLPENDHSTGLVQLFLAEGTPVIHLLNIKSLATAYGLPIDPVPLPEPGEGGVYYTDTYRKELAWGTLAAAAVVFYLGRGAFFPQRLPETVRRAGARHDHKEL